MGVEKEDGDGTSYNDQVKDFVAGNVAGMTQVVVGHPFDTVKVRLQADMHAGGAMSMLRSTVAREGVGGLFKGVVAPTLGSMAVNAVVFSAYGWSQRALISRKHHNKVHGDKRGELSLLEVGLCGGFAGLVNTVVITPIELIKIQLQLQRSTSGFAGPMDACRSIVRTGGLRALYLGNVSCAYREVLTYTLYFGFYEGLRRRFMQPDGSVSAVATMIAGGVGGMTGWALCYPTDVAKSRIQAQIEGQPRRYHGRFDGGMMTAMREVVASHGYSALYRGFVPCILRSFPVNACSFLAYETIMDIDFDAVFS